MSKDEVLMTYDFRDGQHEDGVTITEIEVYNSDKGLSCVMTVNEQNPYGEISIDRANINAYVNTHEDAVDIDFSKDLAIIQVHFDYTSEYYAQHGCQDTPDFITAALYDKCNVYSHVMKFANQLKACPVCEEDLPYKFMYGLLKKKALDASIECGQIDQACRFYNLFFGDRQCDGQSKPCGCGNVLSKYRQSISSASGYVDPDRNTPNITKNCRCHGNN